MDSIRKTANSLAIYNKNENDGSVARSADKSGEYLDVNQYFCTICRITLYIVYNPNKTVRICP